LTDTQPTSVTNITNQAPKNIPIAWILSLKKQGLSHAKIGKELGCSSVNITKRLQVHKRKQQELTEYRENRADIIASVGKRVLDSITDKEIKKAPFGTKATVYGILFDKERLERGESTENIAHIHKVAKGIRDRMRGITSG